MRFCVIFSWFLRLLLWLTAMAAVLLFAIALLLQHGITQPMLERFVGPLVYQRLLLRFDRLQFDFRNGLRLTKLELVRKYHVEKPIASIGELDLGVSLLPGCSIFQRVQSLRLCNVSFPEIPEIHGDSPCQAFDFDIPATREIPVTIERASILGIESRLLTGRLSASGKRIELRDAFTRWPDGSQDIGVRATAELDLSANIVRIQLDGKAYPSHIIPLMGPSCIDAPRVVEWMQKCADLHEPANAKADILLQLATLDYDLFLDISANACSWNGVPLSHLRGRLDAIQRGDFTTIRLRDFHAMARSGGMDGNLDYDNEHEVLQFSLFSQMDLPDALKIVEVLDQNELSVIRCDTPPQISLSGIVSTSDEAGKTQAVTNQVVGKFQLARGAITDFKVIGISGDIMIGDDTGHIFNIRANGEHGGTIDADFLFDFSEYAQGKCSFQSTTQLDSVDLRDLSHMMSITNDRMGKLTGEIHAASTLGTNTLNNLHGDGTLKFSDGVIAQIPLFSGFTPYLAEHVPGVSPLSDLSQGAIGFTITNGVLSTEDAIAEGAMFSLSGRGTYDIPGDLLDLKIRTDFFPKKSVLGFLTRLVTYPFTRLLAEFRISGGLKDPHVTYYDLIEKAFGRSK